MGLIRLYKAVSYKNFLLRERAKPPVKDENGDMVCAECGTYVFPRDYYCPRCGQKLKELNKSWPIKK